MQSFPFPPPPWRRPPVMRWPKPEQPYALKIEVDAAKRATEEVKADLSEHEKNGTIHVTAENKAAWNGKYEKPTTGIPNTDLSSGVQASLAKADTALQAHQDISGKADKSDTYTKTEVDSLVSATGGKFIVVTSLPSAASADPKAIYLVPRSPGESGNIYDEYLRVEPTTGTYAWEKIGSTEVDLSAYRTASAQDAIDGEQNTAIAAKYTKPSGGIPASDLASGVIPAVPVKAVKRNGTALTPDANGAVDITVPTGSAASKDVPTSGNASSTQVVMGNDTRLSDSRTPTAHTHSVGDINLTSGVFFEGDLLAANNKGDVVPFSAPQGILAGDNKGGITTYTVPSGVLVGNKGDIIAGIAGTDYVDPASLAAVATTGSYNDLTNKPTIPAAQVQSNWNETNTSSKAYIQNKPTIPTVPTTVSSFTNDAGYTTEGKRNLLDYTTGTTLALGTAVYRANLASDGTFPTITATGIPTATAYFQFELELSVPSTVPSTITGPSGWTWLDGHGLPDPADLSGGEVIYISCRMDCGATGKPVLASVWRVA